MDRLVTEVVGNIDAAIEVRGLHKSYRKLRAVRGIDLSVARGEVFALLGPNGAGKTTTVEILEGYRGRDSGEVRVLGYPRRLQTDAVLELVGLSSERDRLVRKLSGGQQRRSRDDGGHRPGISCQLSGDLS